MLSIQIDVLKVLKCSFTISSTTSNVPSLQAIWNQVFHYVRVLDTLEYTAFENHTKSLLNCGLQECWGGIGATDISLAWVLSDPPWLVVARVVSFLWGAIRRRKLWACHMLADRWIFGLWKRGSQCSADRQELMLVSWGPPGKQSNDDSRSWCVKSLIGKLHSLPDEVLWCI